VHWFVVDETNKNSVSGQFFIIGGLVCREDQIEKIHSAIEIIRLKRGYRRGDNELLWGVEVEGKRHIGGFGYLEQPNNVRAHTYRPRHQERRGTDAGT
jgi:hypothetical protein